MHAPLSWKVERVAGCHVSITQTLLVSVAVGSRTLPGTRMPTWSSVNSLHCAQHAGWMDQSIVLTPELCAKKEENKEKNSYVMENTTCGLLFFFFLMAVEQNLQYENRALFHVFIYLYNICTDFFLLKMKDELTSGMPENKSLFCFYFLLVWGIKK